MGNLSPFTRKLLAVGLLVLAVLLLLQWVAEPVAATLSAQRDELAVLRMRRARLIATAHRLLPDSSTYPPGLAIDAADQQAAGQRLVALLKGSASVAGVAVQVVPEPGTMPGVVRAHAQIIAPEGATMGFVALVERGTPAVRFMSWHVQGDGGKGAAIVLAGDAAVVWEPAP